MKVDEDDFADYGDDADMGLDDSVSSDEADKKKKKKGKKKSKKAKKPESDDEYGDQDPVSDEDENEMRKRLMQDSDDEQAIQTLEIKTAI